MKIKRTIATSITALALFGLTACSSDEGEVANENTSVQNTETSEPTETPTEETTETPTAEGLASFARGENLAGGEKIASGEVGGLTVDVYQVGVTQATDTGQFVDPDTNQPLIAKGDDIVFVNYVVTNNSDAPVTLGYSLVTVDARYDDWPYLQGMDGVTDDTLFESMKVYDEGPAVGSDLPFTINPGESFSFGENFAYEKDSPITFGITVTPADDEGNIDTSKSARGDITGKIS